MKKKDSYQGRYLVARKESIERSGGKCQFCGKNEATQSHHWAFLNYPSGDDVTSDDLTALCNICHEIATTMRRFLREGGSTFQFRSLFGKVIEECGIPAQLKARPLSSCTTEQQGSTPVSRPISRKRPSQAKKEVIERKSKTSDSKNSNVKRVFGSTHKERLQSRLQQSEQQ